MTRAQRLVLEPVLAAAVGLVAFVAPVLVNPPAALPPAPLFPLIRAAVERPQMGTFVCLGIAGLALGVVGRAPWFLLGAATMACFPLAAFAEMGADPTSHNLFPLEFIMYAIYSIPAIVAAAIGRSLSLRLAAPAPSA